MFNRILSQCTVAASQLSESGRLTISELKDNVLFNFPFIHFGKVFLISSQNSAWFFWQ